MIKLSMNKVEAADGIARAIRRVGIREVSRRTKIPLTTVARRVRDIGGTRFSMVIDLINACHEH
jgi:hypothetical protein